MEHTREGQTILNTLLLKMCGCAEMESKQLIEKQKPMRMAPYKNCIIQKEANVKTVLSKLNV